MKTLRFKVEGNPEDPCGNPMPKLKMTGRQHWTPRARKYVAWKAHVVGAYRQAGGLWMDQIEAKPIVLWPEQRAHMDVTIFFKNKAHGDGENIFGSIADALFKNDKYLDGSFHSSVCPQGKGRVEILINIF